MLNPYVWLRSKFRDWMFKRAFDRAPVKCLGEIYVKEVKGNLYAVEKPLFVPSDVEVIGTNSQSCGCFQCIGYGKSIDFKEK